MSDIRIVNEVLPGTDIRADVAHIKLDFDGVIPIGYREEELASAVAVDITPFLERYGEGEFTIIHKRAQDEQAYPRETVRVDNEVYWIVDMTDCGQVGIGEMQVVLAAGDLEYLFQVKKSKIFGTQVKYASPIEDVGELEPLFDYLYVVIEKAQEIQDTLAFIPPFPEQDGRYMLTVTVTGGSVEAEWVDMDNE